MRLDLDSTKRNASKRNDECLLRKDCWWKDPVKWAALSSATLNINLLLLPAQLCSSPVDASIPPLPSLLILEASLSGLLSWTEDQSLFRSPPDLWDCWSTPPRGMGSPGFTAWPEYTHLLLDYPACIAQVNWINTLQNVCSQYWSCSSY